MKYLYHSPIGQNPIQIKFFNYDKTEYNADDKYTILELFKIKATTQYKKIEIKQPDLYYKTSKSNKKRYNLQGWINLNEYEYGGTIENISDAEAIINLYNARHV